MTKALEAARRVRECDYGMVCEDDARLVAGALLERDAPMREALEEIAKQELSADMSVDDQLGGDFEGAYDHMIELARAALSQKDQT